ncbi:MAG: EAL domain-containing protein [Gammaproteobacteria bacterium]|nr:EAL domain-containing protein [Gammaproteobacteria bacterium]
MNTALLHGYRDTALPELSNDDIYKINYQAAEDFSKRSIPGSIIIFITLFLSINYANSLSGYSWLSNTLIFLLLASIFSRYFILKLLPKQKDTVISRWRIIFSISVITTGLVWGVFQAVNVFLYEDSKFTLITLMFTIGIAGGSAISLFIWKSLAQLYLLTLFLPSIAISLFNWSTLSLGVIFAFTAYYIFLHVQIGRSNKEYWISLYQNKLLKIQSQIIESQAKEEIQYLARHDTLTGLLNRYSFDERLEQALHQASRQKTFLAILAIDLDKFKRVNDSAGHHVGDKVLSEVSERLKIAARRDSDMIARIGGDEFNVVLSDVKTATIITLISNKIIDLLNKPFTVNNSNFHIGGSIGISVFPKDGKEKAALLRNADLALYHAKHSGRNQYQFFNKKMEAQAREMAEIEHDLRSAIHKKQFELYYQPKVKADGGQVIGFEALIRWKHPEKGFIPPDKFISIAESTGQIINIGTWVIDSAFQQLTDWKTFNQQLHIAINVSVQQLRSTSFINNIQNIIKKYDIPAERIHLEITESVAMSDPESSITILNTLKELGFKIAIDDFGTGYSSLAYLKILPVDYLKIDRNFVKEIESDINDRTICDATITLSHSLGLKVVAEGVETVTQKEYLIQKGCDYLQGYYFSKPLPLNEVEDYLTKSPTN